MQLLETQRAFLKAVRREAAASTVDAVFAGDQRLGARARMEVYAGAFFARQLGALREFYPATWAFLGDAFLPLARRYVLGSPGRGAALESMTYEFPLFLEQNLAVLSCPEPDVALELALLERARNRALLAPAEESVVTPEEMPLLTPSQSLRLSAGVEVVFASKRAQQLFAGPPALEEYTNHLLIWRPGFRVQWRSVAEDEACALRRISQGCSVSAVCEEFLAHSEPARRAYEVLSRWAVEEVLSCAHGAREGGES